MLLLVFSMMPNIQIFAQSTPSDSSVLFTTEFLEISLDLISENVQDGNFNDAKILSKLNSEIFPIHLQSLRQTNSGVTDEIHLLLLDIHDEIVNENTGHILENVNLVKNLLTQYSVQSPDYGLVISQILVIVDRKSVV